MVFLTLEFLPPSHPLLSHQCIKHRCSYDLVTKLPHPLAEEVQTLNVANKALWPLNTVWPLQHHLLPPPVSCTQPCYTFLSMDVPQLRPFLLIICWSADSPTSVTSKQSQGLSPPFSCGSLMTLLFPVTSQFTVAIHVSVSCTRLWVPWRQDQISIIFVSLSSDIYQFLGIVFFVFCFFNDSDPGSPGAPLLLSFPFNLIGLILNIM